MILNKSMIFAFSLVGSIFITNIAIAKKSATSNLPSTVVKSLKKNNIPASNISIYVENITDDKILIQHNVNEMRNPASTMKLLTTFAALNTLKPNFTWKTEAWVRGTVSNGVLKGDLVLKGYGDPFLVQENYWKFVRGIYEKGLHEITGNIIIDNSYFALPNTDSGDFDGKPYRLYNAIPSALMYNYQATRLLFQADKKNNKVNITAYPKSNTFTYNNALKLDKGRCKRKHYFPEIIKAEKKINLNGSYSASCGQQYILRFLSPPDQHAYDAFSQFWLSMGGKIGKGLKNDNIKRGDKLFHIYTSKSLGEQIRTINKWSNNVMTRQLLLTLGAIKYGAPGTLEKGRKAILESLSKNDIDNTGIIIDNGSGLSRDARITAKQHAQLLTSAWKNPFMPEFMSSLSLSGLDGTLLNRFRKGEMRGRSHMKTGTLHQVKAIAGYMLNRKGKWLVVVIHHNGPNTGAGRGSKVQNALLQWAFSQ